MRRYGVNREQCRASRAARGTSLVIAGAGTGKTTTMIARVKSQIDAGLCEPETTKVLTFSKKAAEEISRRIEESGAGDVQVSTFHASARGLLYRFQNEFLSRSRYQEFPEVCDAQKARQILDSIIRLYRAELLGLSNSTAAWLIKNRGSDRQLKNRGLLEIITRIRSDFESEKLRQNLIEYEQLVDEAVSLLMNSDTVRQWAADTVKFICVDEFQDTSDNNVAYVRLLAGERADLFAVGDDWQSIYGFRHANVNYIVHPRRYFTKCKIFYLTVNYRSHSEIVDASWKLIRHNRIRTDKRIRSYTGSGGSVSIHRVNDEDEEVDIVKAILEKEGADERCAILYRNNRYGANLKSAVDTGCAQCMTIHASKGLEFERVIVAGLRNSELPSPLSPLEEERRLLYVALSRAKRVLHILCYTGEQQSRFLEELAGK